MGDRGQVFIEDTGVYLYTHWGAEFLIEKVRKVLRERIRWGDDCYLTRIIFDEMIGFQQGTETGFGICTEQHLDVWRLIKINVANKHICIQEYKKPVFQGTFEEFIQEKVVAEIQDSTT